MQPNGQCAPAATGKIVGVDLSDPEQPDTLAPLGAHPALATGGRWLTSRPQPTPPCRASWSWCCRPGCASRSVSR